MTQVVKSSNKFLGTRDIWNRLSTAEDLGMAARIWSWKLSLNKLTTVVVLS
jgi:hypothetical protein